MSAAEYVRSLLLECPHIQSVPGNSMTIQFSDYAPRSYSIEPEPVTQIVKRFLGGDTVRRFSFVLLSSLPTITDADRAANTAHFEFLSGWLETVTRKHMLPPMDDGQTPRTITATGAPYIHYRADDGDTAVYSMQVELIYFQKASEY